MKYHIMQCEIQRTIEADSEEDAREIFEDMVRDGRIAIDTIVWEDEKLKAVKE